jgi:hypothetical protein
MASLISDIQILLPTISLTPAETNGLKNLLEQARIIRCTHMLGASMEQPLLRLIISSFMEDVWGELWINIVNKGSPLSLLTPLTSE